MYPVLKYEELTKAIINEGYYVHRQLGCGFLESVYHNALFMRLSKTGMQVVKEAPLYVQFDGVVVGEFAADLVIENKVIVEVKAVEAWRMDAPVSTSHTRYVKLLLIFFLRHSTVHLSITCK